MAHRFQDPPFSEYWSALRCPSSGWVSEMLAQKLAHSAASDAMTRRLEKKNKGNGRIHIAIFIILLWGICNLIHIWVV